MKCILNTLFVLLAIHVANGQTFYGKYLDHKQGLLSKECYDINLNKEGYLIVGTQYGPMKYDGEKFIPLCTNLPIEKRIMYDFERDPNGKIYLLNSKNEIYYLEKDRAIKLPISNTPPKLPGISYLKLHWYSKGLIVITNHTHQVYSFKTRKLTLRNQSTALRENKFILHPNLEFPIEKIRSSFLRIETHIVEIQPSGKRLVINQPFYSDSRDDFITVGKSLFILVNSSIFRVKGNNVKQLPYSEVLFIEHFNNRIWLATHRGLFELDQNGNLIQIHFPGQTIGGVSPIGEKGLAISTNQSGIFVCSNIHERYFSKIAPTDIVSNKHVILVGNQYGQLFRYGKGRLFELMNYPKLHLADTLLRRKYIHHIEFIKDKWYISNLNSIYSLSTDFKTAKFEHYSEFHGIKDFLITPKNRYVISWRIINTFDSKPTSSDDLVMIPLINCRELVNDSVVLLGTAEGLFEYTLESRKLKRVKFFQDSCYVSHIQNLPNNKLLITTRYKGIFLYQNGSLIQKFRAPSVSLKKAIISEGKIFAAGNHGIYFRTLNEQSKKYWVRIFDNEVQNMFLINKKLFICTELDLVTRELSSLYPQKKTSVILNEVYLGKRTAKAIPAEIDYNTPLSLDFDILQFDADNLDLYYVLKGENTSYQYSKGTKINFDALQSGKYQLTVYPVIDKRIQFNSSKTYSFTISEPFWRSTVFVTLIIILIISMIISIRLMIHLRRKKKQAAQAELVSKMHEYKLLAVKAQVNPHFLSNGLSAIQALILKEENDLAALYLSKFSYLMRKTLHFSETQFITIQSELQIVDAYLELELLRFRNSFDVVRDIRLNEYELNTYMMPSLLLQPILENAIWHGLKQQEIDPVLTLLLYIDDTEQLHIEIRDNGKGFKTLNNNEGHLSKGNKLISERIDTLNQQLGKKVAQLHIDTSENGTTVALIFTPEIYNQTPL